MTSSEITLREQRDARIKVILSVVVMGITFISLFFLSMFSDQTVKKLTTAKQEQVNLRELQQNSESLKDFVQKNEASLQVINTLFPTEDDFIYTLQDIETLVLAVDSKGSVKLGASKPVKNQNQNTIPLVIHLTAETSSVMDFMKKFERLPYILEISDIELRSSPNGGSVLDVMMNVRLYVADPFNT